MARLAWHEFASCADKDPEIFFPLDRVKARDAVIICGMCPVRVECRAYADSLPEVFGVWGGQWYA